MDIYAQKSRNKWVTAVLFAGVAAVVIGLGFGAAWALGVTDPVIAFGVGLVVAAVAMAITWKVADKAVLRSVGARPADPERPEEARLTGIVEGVATAAGIPAPEVYVIDDESLNAFAVGRSPEQGKVAFTTGLLANLERSEVEAVAAHEVSHITGRDSLIGVYTAVVLGIAVIAARVMLHGVLFSGMRGGRRRGGHPAMLLIGLLVAVLAAGAAFLLSRAVSRKREQRADLASAHLTHNPQAMISALEKIDKGHSQVDYAHGMASHLWIEEPGDQERESFLDRLSRSHPPISERIDTLREVAGERPV